MKGMPWILIIGLTIGVVIGLVLAGGMLLFFMLRRRKQAQIRSNSLQRTSGIPLRINGVDTCTELSDSTAGQDSPEILEEHATSHWPKGPKKSVVSLSGILRYSYKDLQKATGNFTTLIGHGAFGPVYKAQMTFGETVAVKVLSTDSKQGEKEFQAEVLLLGRLHHRNLVNLVGYCAEKGKNMLIYAYMTNGSLHSHLYDENKGALGWDLRLSIALDVARGLEYLHDGAVPSVVHRDIKPANILLDHSMRARVADFGLSREEMVNPHTSDVRGTFGYLDPEYVSSRSFTKKSDVYSFGVLLFELIAGRNPQQGLMDYVELAAIGTEGTIGWEEIVDSRLDGAFDIDELHSIAELAYKCIKVVSRKRPSMRDVVQVLSLIIKRRHSRKHLGKRSLPVMSEEESIDMNLSDHHSSVHQHHRDESIESLTDLPDV